MRDASAHLSDRSASPAQTEIGPEGEVAAASDSAVLEAIKELQKSVMRQAECFDLVARKVAVIESRLGLGENSLVVPVTPVSLVPQAGPGMPMVLAPVHKDVPRTLRKVLGKSRLEREELRTSLLEMEAVINARPLTYTYSQAGEPSPVCPAHFLVDNSILANPDPSFCDTSSRPQATRKDVLRKLKYRQRILNHLRERWKKGKLP
ncbi:hypothetical protein HPB49_003484 [Dermacentor silvarum]|uniref:Uncharacterized protein n=1 Tax=Dermacentor silvarum TaxID=543639 RepID=A0ACB8C780_DERSI|nr:hypothetical protein HPB49_003484 [Dermacentor silvarum]